MSVWTSFQSLWYRWNLYTPADKIVLVTCIGGIALSVLSVVFGLGVTVSGAPNVALYRGLVLLVWGMALLTAIL